MKLVERKRKGAVRRRRPRRSFGPAASCAAPPKSPPADEFGAHRCTARRKRRRKREGMGGIFDDGTSPADCRRCAMVVIALVLFLCVVLDCDARGTDGDGEVGAAVGLIRALGGSLVVVLQPSARSRTTASRDEISGPRGVFHIFCDEESVKNYSICSYIFILTWSCVGPS